MKSKNYIIQLLAITIILSSCGSLSFTQMRYTKGVNISFARKEAAKEEQKAKIASKNQSDKSAELSKNNPLDESTTVSKNEPSQSEINEHTIVLNKTNDASINSFSKTSISKFGREDKKTISIIKDIKQSYIKNKTTSFPGKNESNQSDTNIILLIILALFVPPLAVYLYYNEINAQFWISLILTLLAIGAFAASLPYLWAVAVIHAILVILGIFG